MYQKAVMYNEKHDRERAGFLHMLQSYRSVAYIYIVYLHPIALGVRLRIVSTAGPRSSHGLSIWENSYKLRKVAIHFDIDQADVAECSLLGMSQ